MLLPFTHENDVLFRLYPQLFMSWRIVVSNIFSYYVSLRSEFHVVAFATISTTTTTRCCVRLYPQLYRSISYLCLFYCVLWYPTWVTFSGVLWEVGTAYPSRALGFTAGFLWVLIAFLFSFLCFVFILFAFVLCLVCPTLLVLLDSPFSLLRQTSSYFSDVRFSYLALVQDKKITCVLSANACCAVNVNCPPNSPCFSLLR